LQFELVAVVPLLWVVVSGSTLFGLLNWEVLRLMGKLSYSFYLLHVIVLMAVIRLLKQWFPGCLDEPPILGGDYSDFNHSNRSVIGCLLALG